jgi:hypothetical protein
MFLSRPTSSSQQVSTSSRVVCGGMPSASVDPFLGYSRTFRDNFMFSVMILGNGRTQRTCLFSQGYPRGCVEKLDRANYEDTY